ncbi:hypothetical protein M0R45_013602 [Rubus argutus]|uniref:Uncharacterized protein n=1 Tax=Rubus argutus TaxID=59490 RepID=A0AAW1XLM5_RUBAR
MSAQQLIASHRDALRSFTARKYASKSPTNCSIKCLCRAALLPLDDVVEFGYNATSGFVWLKQKETKGAPVRAVGRTVSYDAEVMGFVEEHRMRRLTGVKSKEILIWVSISDIYVDPSSDPDKITFANGTGISRSFPVSAFQLEEDGDGNGNNEQK